jgi:hypothetical protein
MRKTIVYQKFGLRPIIYARVVWQWSPSCYHLGLHLVGDWVYVINRGKKQVKITT